MAVAEPLSELSIPSRAFVLGLADAEGFLDAGALYGAAGAVGLTSTTVRLTLRRLVDADLLTLEGRGRAAVAQLTPAGLAERDVDLSWVAARHRVDAGLEPWDGRWHLVGFEIPESQRAVRDQLREAIVDMFGAPLAGGLYLSPWPIKPWLTSIIDEHRVADRVSFITADVVEVGSDHEPEAIAASVWQLADLEADYRAFVERWAPAIAAPPTGAGAVRAAFEASAEIEELWRRDPVVPLELDPAPAGIEARSTYRALLGELRSEPVIASANVFGAYEAAIERALAQSRAAFWAAALRPTSAR